MKEKLVELLKLLNDDYEVNSKAVDYYSKIGQGKNEEILKLFSKAQEGRLIFNSEEVNNKLNKIDASNELAPTSNLAELQRDVSGTPFYDKNIAQFVNKLDIDREGKIQHPEYKGQKFGRIVSNFIKNQAIIYDIPKEETNWLINHYVQQKWAKKVMLEKDEVLVLSINPIDILLASNGTNWTSCLNLEDGDYKDTVLNYLTMPDAFIAFIAKKDNLEKKIARSWVYLNRNGMSVQHEYPNHDSKLLPYSIFGVLNLTTMFEISEIDYVNAKKEGYVDLVKFSNPIALSTVERNTYDLDSENLCLSCGDQTEHNVYCDCCSTYCDCCGERMDEYNETNDGLLICDVCAENDYVWSDYEDCYISEERALWSNFEDTYFPEDSEDFVYIKSIDDYVLVEDAIQCEGCGEWILPDEVYKDEEDGGEYCLDCIEETEDKKLYYENKVEECLNCDRKFLKEELNEDLLCSDCQKEE